MMLKRILFLFIFLGLTLPSWAASQKDTIYLGMSAAFTGPNAVLGIELYRGSFAYLEKINQEQKGLYGKKIKILTYDDKYEPELTLQNTFELVDEKKIIWLFDYVGTPTVNRILPYLSIDNQHGAFLFFPLTGGLSLRKDPYKRYVLNLRPSYTREIQALLTRFLEIGKRRIGIFYQLDAFGRSGWQSARDFLKQKGLEIVADASYIRGCGLKDSYRQQVEVFKKNKVDVILSIASTSAATGFIRDLRDAQIKVPVANLSFVDAQAMFLNLSKLENENNRSYSFGLVNSVVVPFFELKHYKIYEEYLATLLKYKADIKKYAPADYNHPFYGPISFEGFLNAKLIVEILKRLGPSLDRSKLEEVIYNPKGFEIGLEDPVVFTRDNQGALKEVYFATIKDGMLHPLKDFRTLFY
ncbi:MAG: hypothetical protein PWR24_155 [Desulfonauticus sp.]|nr:MAG: hypothetical protein XD41_0172 [Desulfonauticus sp. 38_4375]MDK2920598.1 hypothetical protein [Desulfonauticus sp.]